MTPYAPTEAEAISTWASWCIRFGISPWRCIGMSQPGFEAYPVSDVLAQKIAKATMSKMAVST